MTDDEILARFASIEGAKLTPELLLELRDADDAMRARLLDTWTTAGVTSSAAIAELKAVATSIAAGATLAGEVGSVASLVKFLVGLA